MNALRSDPTVTDNILDAAVGEQWRTAERNDRIISSLAETSYAKQSFTLLQSPNVSNWSRDVAKQCSGVHVSRKHGEHRRASIRSC